MSFGITIAFSSESSFGEAKEGKRLKEFVSDVGTSARCSSICAGDLSKSLGEALETLHAELLDSGVELAFAELKDPVRDVLRRYGVEQQIGEQRFFPQLACGWIHSGRFGSFQRM